MPHPQRVSAGPMLRGAAAPGPTESAGSNNGGGGVAAAAGDNSAEQILLTVLVSRYRYLQYILIYILSMPSCSSRPRLPAQSTHSLSGWYPLLSFLLIAGLGAR
jgi:hypothetical protein